MATVEMFSKMMCPYCARAKRLLESKGVTIEEHDITMGGPKRAEMLARAGGRSTVPQIFIGDTHVGGSDDLAALERAGKLDALLGRLMRAALLQMRSGIDPAANAETLVAAVHAAKAAGADMLFTPEMSGLLDRDRARAVANIVGEGDDRVLAAVRDAAAAAGLWVQLGSLALKGEGTRCVNRGFVIDAGGAIRARYDKIHLFDVDLPDGGSWRESAAYEPGAGSVVVATPWGMLGLAICYDLRFPDLFRALTDAGATMLSVPAAFTVPTGAAHWHVLLRARAIEAGAFVIAAAQGGRHADGRETYGHSIAIDPWGEPLLDMGADAIGLGYATLDPARLEAVRARIPAIAHRRPIAAPVRA